MKNVMLVILLLVQYLNAQNEQPLCMQYNWAEVPSYNLIISDTLDFAAIKEKHIVEYIYDENGQLAEYNLEHKVLFLNSDEKIEENNKIYIPFSSSSKLLMSKARVITPAGRIIVLDDSKVMIAKDEETGNQTKYFALEGIEKGSFIEYYHLQQRQPSYSGKRITMQDSYLKEDVEFELFSPSNLIFEFKSYNGLPSVARDTLTTNRNHWKIVIDKLESLEEEDNSSYRASLGYLVYKLDKNTARNLYDISSYGKVSQNIYDFYYSAPNSKTTQIINNFISEALPKKSLNTEDKIRELEFYIKNNVFKTEGKSDNLEELDEILQNKVANTTGLVKLYVALFNALKLDHELVITSDRTVTKFDKAFEANNFLTDFLFYFPEFETYLSPEEVASRYGYPPVELTDNYGLFIREVKIGDFKSALGEIKYIKPIPAAQTIDRMALEVDFDLSNLQKNNIHMERAFTGYYAMYMQPYMHLVKDKDRDELIDGVARFINENVTIISKEVNNEDPRLFDKEPIEFNYDITSDSFTEKAGKKYLFKIGELIGPQMELYHDKDRKLEMDNGNQRTYVRTITVNIPEGYEFTNLDDLVINNYYNSGDKSLFSFKSSYNLNNNQLVITADEHYSANLIHKDLFGEYRKVINSAADFNKVVLILEPVGP